MRQSALVASLVLAAACAAPTPATTASAPAEAEGGGFVVTLGNDTVAVERFVRTATRLEGAMMYRTPSTGIARYAVDFDAGGRPLRYEVAVTRPDSSPFPGAPRRTTVTFGDTIRFEAQRDTAIRRSLAGGAGAMPLLANSFALYETALRALRATRADTGAMQFYVAGAPRLTAWPVRFVSPTEARVYYFGDAQRVTLDDEGRVLSVDATGTTNKVRVQRTAPMDVEAIARDFWAREQAGAGYAQTTRDTVRATAAGATITVDYGRPVARGRQLFGPGGIVPSGAVWRTGANAATHLRTDRELVFGTTSVPAGTYTLYTLPMADGRWWLIVNRQTGQWGTVYDQAQDLARIPLQVQELPEPVERFTIAVEPGGVGGTLALLWGRTRLSAPFAVK